LRDGRGEDDSSSIGRDGKASFGPAVDVDAGAGGAGVDNAAVAVLFEEVGVVVFEFVVEFGKMIVVCLGC